VRYVVSGILPNSRKHQFKIFGAYAITPDWTVGANLYITSGTPKLCRGGYGPDQVALNGSHTYFWCGGKPVPPGSLGFTPWIHDVGVNLDYKPVWAGHKLDFNLAVFNLFNEQTPIFYNDSFGTTAFVQNINRLRALEGELARSIETIDGIDSVRVHLVIPERQIFSREDQTPSASVVLRTQGTMDRGEVAAIQHLVAAAVAGLTPKQSKAVKRLSAKLGRSPADIMDEAVKDLLAKYGQR